MNVAILIISGGPTVIKDSKKGKGLRGFIELGKRGYARQKKGLSLMKNL
jgi:hypothetical protein